MVKGRWMKRVASRKKSQLTIFSTSFVKSWQNEYRKKCSAEIITRLKKNQRSDQDKKVAKVFCFLTSFNLASTVSMYEIPVIDNNRNGMCVSVYACVCVRMFKCVCMCVCLCQRES